MGIVSRRGGAAVALSAVVATLALPTVAPSPAGAKDQATGVRIPARAAQAAASFWTPRRMRQAMPVERWLEQGGSSLGDRSGADRGTPRPRPTAATSSGFDPVADPTAPVSRVNGVIFFRFLFSLARCSGTSVNGPNLSIVVTAGHCVSLGAGSPLWFTERWAFVPAYRAGQHPYGVFPARWLGATQGWLTDGSLNSDVGIAVVGRNERGQRLGRAVGGTGIAWNLSPKQVFDVHGYPAEKPYDGRTQRTCTGTGYVGHDPQAFLYTGPLNLGVDCRVTEGASGGGWTIRGNRLNGVTSYAYDTGSPVVFGPYFGKEVARLYRQAGKIR